QNAELKAPAYQVSIDAALWRTQWRRQPDPPGRPALYGRAPVQRKSAHPVLSIQITQSYHYSYSLLIQLYIYLAAQPDENSQQLLPVFYRLEAITMTSQANIPDLSNLWMPFTANRQFKEQPRLLAKAKGMYYTSTAGHQVMD